MEELKKFERDYMDGAGSRYDGDDRISHVLFRQFLGWFGKKLPSIIARYSSGNVEVAEVGVKDGDPISLTGGDVKEYLLPENSMLFAIELKGRAEVEIGYSEEEIGSLGSIDGESGAVLSLGLMNIRKIYLRSDTNVVVVPIIYKR